MNRRSFLKAGGSALAVTASNGLAAPAISQRAAARTLRFVPHADLAYFDPIWSNAYIARNAGLLVWDTLYGIDATLKPQRQMIEAAVGISDPLGWTGILRMNHLFPPFNDVRARRAILMAIGQEDYMQSFVGNDATMWRPMPGFFTPGTPLYTEEGGEILKGPRDLNAAKRLLAESGYSGEPITLLAGHDLPPQKGWGDLTVDLLMRLEMH